MDRYLKRFLEALDAIQLRYLVVGAVGSLFGFAMLYYVGSFHGWGLKDTNNAYISFGSCLYFSVVTFTSLGFGDLVPLGIGRLLAGIEVILGLTVFGLAVAKLSSYKQSYLLNQLYARDVQGKLDLFAEELRAHRSACKQLTLVLKNKESQTQALGKLIENVKTDLTRIRAFVSFETRNGYLLSNTPTGSITRLLKALSSLMPKITEVASVRRTRSSQKHRESAQEAIRLALKISRHFADTKNDSTTSEANLLKTRCEAASLKLRGVSDEVEIELKRAESARREEFEARTHPVAEQHLLKSPVNLIPEPGSNSISLATSGENAGILGSSDPR